MISDIDHLSIEDQQTGEFVQKLISIGQAQSNAMATFVVLYRSLGMFKQLAVVCMAELARRRNLGEEFDYETYIETELNKVPKIPNMNLDSVRGLLNIQALAKMVKK